MSTCKYEVTRQANCRSAVQAQLRSVRLEQMGSVPLPVQATIPSSQHLEGRPCASLVQMDDVALLCCDSNLRVIFSDGVGRRILVVHSALEQHLMRMCAAANLVALSLAT